MPNSATTTTTGVSRRHGPVVEELGFASRFISGKIQPEPATPTMLPRPHGELRGAPIERIVRLAEGCWDSGDASARRRGQGAQHILEYLTQHEGCNWQQRWDASPLASGEIRVQDLAVGTTAGPGLGPGLRSLLCLRVIQPSLLAFRANVLTDYASFFVAAQQDPLLDKYAEQAAAQDVPHLHRREALFDVCCLLTVQGIALADLTPAALLYHAHENRRVRAIVHPGNTKYANRFAGLSAWNVLHRMGHFPPDAPATMRAAMHRGQLSVEQMLDRYSIQNRAVRQLLLDYFHRRAADTDYASLTNLVLLVAHHFWETIEKINPGQPDLRISPQVYARWREMISTRDDGKPRAGQDSIVIAVRSFYYDLHTWAADEPERWGPWVAPCPVPPAELRGLGKRRRRINDRSADRTRQRQPLLPILVKHVEDRYDHARTLLERARQAGFDETFVFGGRIYRWIVTDADRHRHRSRFHEVPLRVRDEATGEVLHLETDEEAAFWDWACVETLRHSGVRIEEMCELTHLSVRQYQRPNGEVIALLVIAPSKTDRERVIPMSTELFHVIASVIRRHTRDGHPVPLLSRFDPHDKVWSPPMPFLFQRRIGSTRNVIAAGTVLNILTRLSAELAEHYPAFRTARFTPHDFRRIFATELVNSGLPIHIGAVLLGHMNVQTTRGYIAIFDEDVVRHYAAFLEQRRQLRPAEEYRPLAAGEWDEFDEHFDKRKVELGSCGRPYGTPCQHEHACIRCPMLHVNPKMLARLNELEADLLARRERAEAEGWAGEIEGIDVTLTFLRAKQDDTQRRAQRPVVNLGLPLSRSHDHQEQQTVAHNLHTPED